MNAPCMFPCNQLKFICNFPFRTHLFSWSQNPGVQRSEWAGDVRIRESDQKYVTERIDEHGHFRCVGAPLVARQTPLSYIRCQVLILQRPRKERPRQGDYVEAQEKQQTRDHQLARVATTTINQISARLWNGVRYYFPMRVKACATYINTLTTALMN